MLSSPGVCVFCYHNEKVKEVFSAHAQLRVACPFLITYVRPHTHTKEERNPYSHSLIFVSLGVFKIWLSTPIQLLISLHVIIHFRTDFAYFILD